MYESKTWIVKANNRGLINENDFNYLKTEINTIAKMLNAYIKSIGTKNASQTNEPEVDYGNPDDSIFH